LAASANITSQQVTNWFVNARARMWKPLVGEAEKQIVGERTETTGAPAIMPGFPAHLATGDGRSILTPTYGRHTAAAGGGSGAEVAPHSAAAEDEALDDESNEIVVVEAPVRDSDTGPVIDRETAPRLHAGSSRGDGRSAENGADSDMDGDADRVLQDSGTGVSARQRKRTPSARTAKAGARGVGGGRALITGVGAGEPASASQLRWSAPGELLSVMDGVVGGMRFSAAEAATAAEVDLMLQQEEPSLAIAASAIATKDRRAKRQRGDAPDVASAADGDAALTWRQVLAADMAAAGAVDVKGSLRKKRTRPESGVSAKSTPAMLLREIRDILEDYSGEDAKKVRLGYAAAGACSRQCSPCCECGAVPEGRGHAAPRTGRRCD
jgi:hypothetical protein